MWGQEFDFYVFRLSNRIIPTRVGTSSCLQAQTAFCRDHPHACGDKKMKITELSVKEGSSPRVWGQVFTSVATASDSGIIPTRVGTRFKVSRNKRKTVDHPHACGDKLFNVYSICLSGGSSPRVWGQGCVQVITAVLPGIIPTRVGTSLSAFRALFHLQDHPHACGDKWNTYKNDIDKAGSSPRVWGQVCKTSAKLNEVRIIPTRVGTS